MASSVSAFTNATAYLTKALTGNKSGFTNNTIEDMNSGNNYYSYLYYLLLSTSVCILVD